MGSVHDYVSKYNAITESEPCVLVYHPTQTSSWTRVDSENADTSVDYNHRSIYLSEVIIEYDEDSKHVNYKLAKRCSKNLTRDNKKHSMWWSGNRSTHIHVFFEFHDVVDIYLMKKIIMRQYGRIKHRGEWIEPDMGLASENHLIRAECGVHEKTGNHKTLLDEDYQYPRLNSVPPSAWETFDKEFNKRVESSPEEVKGMLEDHPGFQYLVQPENMREVGDGKKRFLFVMVNTLQWTKFKDDKEGLKKFAKDWWEKVGGVGYDEHYIENMVNHGIDKGYTPGPEYFRDLLSDLDLERFIK